MLFWNIVKDLLEVLDLMTVLLLFDFPNSSGLNEMFPSVDMNCYSSFYLDFVNRL